MNATTDSEIKKTYRRLMSQHHPDKLMAKRLLPEMIKLAI
nr:DnaJ domain-containing protein [Coxiella-like endosymbiont]